MKRLLIALLSLGMWPLSASASLLDFSLWTPVNNWREYNMADGKLNTRWINDDQLETTYFEIILGDTAEIEALNLAIGRQADRPFDVYVDGEFVGSFVYRTQPEVALQGFQLPPGTRGDVIRVDFQEKPWLGVHEVQVLGSLGSGGEADRFYTEMGEYTFAPGEGNTRDFDFCFAEGAQDRIVSWGYQIHVPAEAGTDPDNWPRLRLMKSDRGNVAARPAWSFTLVNDSAYPVDVDFYGVCER